MFAGLIASFISSTALRSDAQSEKGSMPPAMYGGTGPLQQLPLDSIPPEPPQVKYQDGELTIIALNSTLGDILRCIREKTAAEIQIPAVTERVVTRLGPGPVREVLSELLNGTHFNYVLLESSSHPIRLTRVVLQPKTEVEVATPGRPAAAKLGMSSQPPRMIANEAPAPIQPLVVATEAPAADSSATSSDGDLPAVEPPPTDGPVEDDHP